MMTDVPTAANVPGLRVLRALAVLVAMLLPASAVMAQKSPQAIVRIKTGDTFRYVYRLETDETLTQVDKPNPNALATKSIQETQVLFTVAADTTSGNIVDATFETFRVWVDLQDRLLPVDVSAANPPAESDVAARQIYERFRPLVGLTARLNVSISGEITHITIPESIKAEPAWPVFRRYLDQDLFRATFGPIFTLKSDGPLLNIGEPWYYRVHAYARATECAVWETRTLQGVVGSIATVTGQTKATGKPEDFQNKPVAFLDMDVKCEYAWNVERARLLKHTRNDTIRTRFHREGMVMNSDLIGASTLTLKEDNLLTIPVKPAAPPTPAAAPTTTPAAPPATAPTATPAPSEHPAAQPTP